jgi:uncharacterized protein
MKPVRLIQIFVASLLFSLVPAQAQEAGATPAPTPGVAAEKRILIKEILDLTNSRQSSEAMFSAQFDEMDKQMPEIQWQAIASMEELKRLTPAQQQEVRARVKESSMRLSKRIKELFVQRIDMKQLVEDISYTVYDKHFTEAELKDLVTFYGSATGKKVIAEMPALFAESIAKAGELIAPKVKEIVEETQKEQVNELTREVELLLKTMPRTPVKKKSTSARRRA